MKAEELYKAFSIVLSFGKHTPLTKNNLVSVFEVLQELSASSPPLLIVREGTKIERRPNEQPLRDLANTGGVARTDLFLCVFFTILDTHI